MSAETVGDTISMYNLGCNYFYGNGVETDYKEAVKWFTRAAQKGHAGAQNNLGVCYENGYGVEKNIYEAIKWYRTAANQEEKWLNELNNQNEGIRKARLNFDRLRKVVVATPQYDKHIVAKYPKNRIDNLLGTICLIGIGLENDNPQIEEYIMNVFTKYTDVKIIDSRNLKSFIGGKILEFGAGLTAQDSQRIAKLLQVDHIIYYREKVSPHSDYIIGGRAYVEIEVKIVNPIDGEIIFNVIGNYGGVLPDPRIYGFTHRIEMDDSSKNLLRRLCWEYYIQYPLLYALGAVDDGYTIYSDAPVVETVIINSPAHKAGIVAGDRIVEIGGTTINDASDFHRYYSDTAKSVTQSDTINILLKRGDKDVSATLEYPIIPEVSKDSNNYDNRETPIQRHIQMDSI
jgi:hypothetical protein